MFQNLSRLSTTTCSPSPTRPTTPTRATPRSWSPKPEKSTKDSSDSWISWSNRALGVLNAVTVKVCLHDELYFVGTLTKSIVLHGVSELIFIGIILSEFWILPGIIAITNKFRSEGWRITWKLHQLSPNCASLLQILLEESLTQRSKC